MHRFLSILLSITLAGGPAFAERRRPSNEGAPAPVGTPLPDSLTDQDLRIDNSLASAASGTRLSRYVLGGVLVGASLYLSGVYIAQERFTTGDVAYVAKGVVGFTGVIFLVSGIATAFVPGEAERAYPRYHLLPAKTEKQLREKVLFGESELRRVAAVTATNRAIIGGLFGAVGLADIVWFLGTGPNTQLNFLAYLGGLYIGFGALLLLLRFPAEREYEEHIKFDIRPLPNGASAGVRWTF